MATVEEQLACARLRLPKMMLRGLKEEGYDVVEEVHFSNMLGSFQAYIVLPLPQIQDG